MTHTSNTLCLFCNKPVEDWDRRSIDVHNHPDLTALVHHSCLSGTLKYHPNSNLIAARTTFKLPKKLKT